jgi:hypothetical protein
MIGPCIDIRDAVDVHVHSEPDLFPRNADDVGAGQRHNRIPDGQSQSGLPLRESHRRSGVTAS